MLFWTIVFITYHLAFIVRGNLYHDIMKKSGELTLKQAETEDKKEKDNIAKELVKKAWPIWIGSIILIAEIIYILSALKIDVLKYPTAITLFYMIFVGLILSKVNKEQKYDLKIEEDRTNYKLEIKKLKRYTFKGIISNLIYITYYCYMFYLLALK